MKIKKYKNYIITILILITCCISVCFIPINASRLIPAVEKQVNKDLGVTIHIERLILRLGPSLKIKAPMMHIMYNDGRKFGQFNNVKFFVPWSSLLKNNIVIKRVQANKFIAKINSDDQELITIFDKLKNKKFEDNPDILLKNYNITYNDVLQNKKYSIVGKDFEVAKLPSFENFKFKAYGEFFINSKKYLSYDVSILPNIAFEKKDINFDINSFISQMESLDFYSDIIADIKLSKNLNDELQISGLINIDNILVLDPARKTPKSFIYLTFLGNKVGVLSNIFASNDKKIYIDGVVNHSKKSSIDVKVKTDDIQLKDIFYKVKLLTDFSKLKAITDVNGKLSADFTIKGDFSKIKSSGFMKLTNANIKAGSLNIKNINSDIDFSNNVINISNAVGYVNDAPIMLSGSINKNLNLELLMNKVQLNNIFPDQIGIKKGVASLVANISGTFDNIIHKENLLVENFILENKENKLSFDTLKIDTNKDNVAYINNIMFHNSIFNYVKVPSLKLYIEPEYIKIPDTNIFMANSKLSTSADISHYATKDLAYNLNLKGVINSRDINKLKQNHTTYPLNVSIQGNNKSQNMLFQVLNEKALVFDEPTIINLVAKSDYKNIKIEDLSVSSFKGKFENDFKSNLKGSKKITVTGNIDNFMDKDASYKNIRIFIPQLLNLNYMDNILQLKGDLFINGKIKAPDIVGQVAVQNFINQFLQLSINNLTVDFNKDLAVLNAPQIKIGDSALSVNSTISTNFSKELLIKNIIIKSKYLNTDTILMYKDTPLFNLIPIKIIDGKFYSERLMASIYNSPLHLLAFTSDFALSNEIVNLKNISAEFCNGKLAGHMNFNLKDESFSSKIQARGVSASPIFDVVSAKKDSVSGVMDFDTNVEGNLTTKNSLFGNIKFVVRNGRMGSLGKLEHLLYAQNVIADNMLRTSLSVVTKAITLKDTGLFKYLRGDVELSNGIANVKLLQSQGPLMSLYIKGTYNPQNDYGKLIVLGRLSDEIISGLGAFGDFSFNKLMVMLTGEENQYDTTTDDLELLPQLPMKNTKEFRSVINGIVDKASSVISFNWISYSKKSYRQKEVPMTDVKVPDFVDSLPY